MAQNKSDTAAVAADSARSADATTARTTSSDTATAKPSAGEKGTIKAAATTKPAAPAGTEAARDNGVTGAEAMTGVHTAAPAELSVDQVKQLQVALKKAGCYSGTPDGVNGPGTQRAIECGLKKYKLGPNETGELYRKLGLKF